MSPDEKKVFDDYFELFSTPGWDRLMRELQDNANVMGDVRYCKTLDEMRLNQGKLIVTDYMLNLKEMMQRAYDEAQNEATG